MSGREVAWGQATRGRRWSLAHLFWRDAATGLDAGHQAVCGYDPTRGLPPGGSVAFRPALPKLAPAALVVAGLPALACSRCLARWGALAGRVYYPLGEHPADAR